MAEYLTFWNVFSWQNVVHLFIWISQNSFPETNWQRICICKDYGMSVKRPFREPNMTLFADAYMGHQVAICCLPCYIQITCIFCVYFQCFLRILYPYASGLLYWHWRTWLTHLTPSYIEGYEGSFSIRLCEPLRELRHGWISTQNNGI